MVYGFRFEADIDEDGPMDGCGNAYCQSKIDGERLLLPMHDPGRFDVIILRPGDVYGPDSVPWVRTPVRRMRAGQFAVPGPGTGIMNHVFVDNLVDAVLLLVRERARAGGRAFNCTDGARTPWLEYFTRLARAAGCPPPAVLEADTMRQLLALPATDPRRARFDAGQPPVSVDYQTRPHRYSSARLQALGFVPRVDLDAGMRRVADALGRAA